MAFLFSLPTLKLGQSSKKSVTEMCPFVPVIMTNLSRMKRQIIP